MLKPLSRTLWPWLLLVVAACGAQATDQTPPSSTATTTGPTSLPTSTTAAPALTTTTQAETTSLTPTSTAPPEGSTPPSAGPFTCTMVVGFSQTQAWYTAGTFEEILPDAEWELRGKGGAAIQLWANPAYEGWSRQTFSACAGEPDRMILTITGQGRSVDRWVADIQAAAATGRANFPSIREVILQPTIGGPDHALCEVGGVPVRAAENHPVIDEAIAEIVASTEGMRAGISPEVSTCADYEDSIGHLVGSANGPMGAEIANFYLTFE